MVRETPKKLFVVSSGQSKEDKGLGIGMKKYRTVLKGRSQQTSGMKIDRNTWRLGIKQKKAYSKLYVRKNKRTER